MNLPSLTLVLPGDTSDSQSSCLKISSSIVTICIIYFRYLFWTDTDNITPKIERSDLTGNMRTLLVTRALLRPTSIVSDIAEQRIYWTDADRNTIETATYSGSDRRLLSRLEGSTLYDIAVSQVICAFASMFMFNVPPTPKVIWR